MAKIYLIRHGQSIGNVDRTAYLRMPDSQIYLTPEGERQATDLGKELFSHLYGDLVHARPWYDATVWCSPYTRARQTAKLIMEEMKSARPSSRWSETKESILLCEQQYGLFDGLHDDELATTHPIDFAHHKRLADSGAKFWARIPLGESHFDVAVRANQFIQQHIMSNLPREHADSEEKIFFVVCHGVMIRALTMMLCGYSPEWFEAERNPSNCAVRLITADMSDGRSLAVEDEGYLFE